MVELIAGVVVAFVAVAVVLQPLFAPWAAARAAAADAAEVEFVELEESESPKIQALLALREIEFDRATGKLSDDDYAALKAKYAALALEAIQAEEGERVEADAATPADRAEALIREVAGAGTAICSVCGPRPEDDAAFCSQCGRPLLAGRPEPTPPASAWRFCTGCGGTLSADAQFCSTCGTKVETGVGA